jgi:hypothetical protein
MRSALIFSAVVAAVAAPFPVCIGLFGRDVRRRRLEVDRGVPLENAVCRDPEAASAGVHVGDENPNTGLDHASDMPKLAPKYSSY